MLERYTEQARQALTLAVGEARLHHHDQIQTGHVLVGLLRVGEGLAARALESLDVDVPRVRAQILQSVGPGRGMTAGQLPFSPRAKDVLGVALREALALGVPDVGTEHVLLAIAGDRGCLAARILSRVDAEPDMIRDEILRLLSEQDLRRRACTDLPGAVVVRVEDIGTLSSEMLDELIERLTAQERAISFIRRMQHATIDVLRAERQGRA